MAFSIGKHEPAEPLGPSETRSRMRITVFSAELIYERSRIHLGPDKRVLVTSRLAKRLRHHGLTNYGDYCDLLRSPEGEEELQFLIDRISTNHTHFFREAEAFRFSHAR